MADSGSVFTQAARVAADGVFDFNISTDGRVARNSGVGDDQVNVSADPSVAQVRLTFTSAEVGNNVAGDGRTLANQDGGLAVRMQAEGSTDTLNGAISRFDDEGIRFVASTGLTFDVRDLVSGTARGDQFSVVQLGTNGADMYDATGRAENYYVNGGMGNDTITGGLGNDFLVGGAGDDTLRGGQGNNSYIGGAGRDVIIGNNGNDTAILNITNDGKDYVKLGDGLDTVNIAGVAGQQVRLTFTSAEVGNDLARDSGTLANQDGGLAVRVQAEGPGGALRGATTRVDDEGIRFVSTTAGQTFDVRDLVSGTARGDLFSVVQLGTNATDVFDESASTVATYVNAGLGDDRVLGGAGADFLVGGGGNDRLNGNTGIDSYIGGLGNDTFVFTAGSGNDTVFDFVSGTDKLDLSAFGIDFADVSTVLVGTTTVVAVDTDSNGSADFQITLLNANAPAQSDYIFGA